MENKLIYIAGFGRSGSTLLGNLLGQDPEIEYLGEIGYVWERGFMNNELCGCSRTFANCGFWSLVKEKLETHFSSNEIYDIFRELNDFKRTRRFINPTVKKYPKMALGIKTLYSKMFSQMSEKVIVDSTKWPLYGYILPKMVDCDIFFIHLVRDPRAVTFSWSRKKERPEINAYMKQLNAGLSALLWLTWNLFIEFAFYEQKKSGKLLKIKYEDFVESPETEVPKIFQMINYYGNLEFSSEKKIVLEPTHTVSGNPSRFNIGEITIAYDSEWEKKMKLIDKIIVSILTWPLLLYYRYKVVA